jgi:hypothetical protein
MVDSDDVLLLRPASAGQPMTRLSGERPSREASGDGPGLVAVTIYPLGASGSPDAFAALFEALARPALEAFGAALLGALVTEESPNTYPRLPVREGERVFVSITSFPHLASQAERRAALEADPNWRESVAPALRPRLIGEPQRLRLKPTARSLMHG